VIKTSRTVSSRTANLPDLFFVAIADKKEIFDWTLVHVSLATASWTTASGHESDDEK